MILFPFHKYPYSNFHELNLDWILNKLKEIEEQIKNIDIDVDISTDPIIIEIQQNIQQLQTSIAQTNQNVQGLQTGVANLGQQIHSLTNRVAALENEFAIIANREGNYVSETQTASYNDYTDPVNVEQNETLIDNFENLEI